MNPETHLHIAVCRYIKYQYPGVLFTSDGSGMTTSQAQAKLSAAVRSGKGWPDLFIAEARRGYHGLFIELKRDRDQVYMKNGNYRNTEHVNNQRDKIAELHNKGYQAVFACGFDEAKRVIDEYLKTK